MLFHGPGARDAAVTEAKTKGRLVSPPIGDEGLRVAEARDLVLTLSAPAIGDRQGYLVIGPMDKANEKACDALLKTLEEYQPGNVIPLLWAEDIEEVSPTIRSRCQAQWAFGEGEQLPEESLDLAWQLCEAVLEGDVHQVASLLQDGKADLESLGRSLARCVSEQTLDGSEDHLGIWESLRPELGHLKLSPVGFLHSLLRASLQGIS